MDLHCGPPRWTEYKKELAEAADKCASIDN